MKIRVEYLLSEVGRKASLLAGGDGKELQVIETNLTPELLERAYVDRDGRATWGVKYIIADTKIAGTYDFIPFRLDVSGDFYTDHKPRIEKRSKQVYFDAPQTVEGLLAFVEATEAKIATKVAELESLLPEKIALWKQGATEHKERARKATEERERRESAAKVERERLEAEKAEWIDAHGSDYLRRATALDYDCQRRYVEERATLELPDFTVDFDNRAGWRSRACPSEEALAEVERLIAAGRNAEVVWLISPPYKVDGGDDDWGENDFEPCEAIVARSYLGKYDLVKIL